MKNIQYFIHLSLLPGLFPDISLSCFPGNTLGHTFLINRQTHLHLHPHFKEHGLISGLWNVLTPLTKSPTFHCNGSKQSPSQRRLLFATSTRDGGFISLLPDFQFSHSQLCKAKHTPPYPLTKNCWIPTELLQCGQSSQPHPHYPRRQAPLSLLRQGWCVRLYFKAKPVLAPFNVPWVCNFALQSCGGYIFLFVRRAPSSPAHAPSFLRG